MVNGHTYPQIIPVNPLLLDDQRRNTTGLTTYQFSAKLYESSLTVMGRE